jgi:hypothetical protein
MKIFVPVPVYDRRKNHAFQTIVPLGERDRGGFGTLSASPEPSRGLTMVGQ